MRFQGPGLADLGAALSAAAVPGELSLELLDHAEPQVPRPGSGRVRGQSADPALAGPSPQEEQQP